MTKLRMGLAAFALFAFGGLAIGQNLGLLSNLPIIGGAAYCSSSTNNVCTNTVPAGPSLTGLESVGVDTNASSMPASAKISLDKLGIGPFAYNAPVTGASITVGNKTRRLIIDPLGTIASLTVVFPAASVLTDGQLFDMCSTQIVTSLTITNGTNTNVANKPTAMTVPVTTGAASCPGWIYRQANTTWYRTH